ncbi:hypothetical protein [Dactylosporangium salmoneum]|uniref:Cell wall-active antibiotics response LiaF-like C-terminal domain-containing protein n=1 Tax=Dactylosporangium salmoneum TaxID=53361 RepID=A0ABP5UZN7_9ACTN
MGTGRAVVLVVFIGVGAVATVEGSSGIERLLRLLTSYGAYLAITIGLLGVLASMLPPAGRAWPLVLLAGGCAALAVQRGWLSMSVVPNLAGLAALGIGGWLMARGPRTRDRMDPVRQLIAVMLPRTLTSQAGERLPAYLTVLTVGARVVVDLRAAAVPPRQTMQLAVSCWAFGSVELRLPEHWAVVGGRLGPTFRVRMIGKADTKELLADTDAPAATDVLADVRSARLRGKLGADAADHRAAAIVVHIAGFGGRVVLADR